MIATIFEGATIIDGTGTAAFTTDVGIVDERIALVGDLADREALHRVACNGKVLAPGFIDTHSHTDEQWLHNSQVANKLLQGCTTEVIGTGGRTAHFATRVAGTDFADYLQAIEQSRPSLNVAALAGFDDAERAGPNHIAMLRDACEQGALGLSASAEAVTRLGIHAIADAVRQSRATLLAVELSENTAAASSSLAEFIAVLTDVRLRIGNLRTHGARSHASMYALLEQLSAARDRGCDVAGDAYPYIGRPVALRDLLPPNTTPALLRDEGAIRAFSALLAIALDERFDRAILAGTREEDDARWYGYTLEEYANAQRLTPARAAVQLLERNAMDVDTFVLDASESDLATAFTAPFVVPATSDGAYAMRPEAHRLPHPRAFGTFPRTIARFSGRLHALTLHDAVARMTSVPAALYGLRDRGTIAVGNAADLVVFDRDRFIDTATYAQPYAAPAGLSHVYVNGRAAVRDGTPTGIRAGRLLRKEG